MASKRPSYLKRQKEQKRNARALEKREARRARKAEKGAESAVPRSSELSVEGGAEQPEDSSGD